MTAYRERDLRPVIEELQEKLEKAEAEAEEAKALVPKRRAALSSVHRAITDVFDRHSEKALWTLAGIAAAGFISYGIYAVATLPKHTHVMWQGQPALRNTCRDREAAVCHAEARTECQGEYANLNLSSKFHPEHTEYEPYTTIDANGNPTTQWHYVHYDAYTDYVLTYRCKVTE